MQILIKGKAGEGKTTLAVLIAQTLREHGLTNVQVQDEDAGMEPTATSSDLETRLQGISHNPIKIQTVSWRTQD